MLFSIYSIVIVLSAFIFSVIGCFTVRYVLNVLEVMDHPNERSNHELPVPRGGGIAVIFTLVSFLFIVGVPGTVLLGMIGLAIISFLDDREGVDFRLRLIVQFLAVGILFVPGGVVPELLGGPVFQGILPLWLDSLFSIIMLVGFLNLFNFMDGIDGITAAQSIALGLGFVFISFFVTEIKIIGVEGLVIAATMAAFLLLNWHPASLFLGDVGSIPLGYLLGFLLLGLAANGYWGAALILPAYYLTDGGMTFVKRLLNKEKIWEAHSKHAYQQAVRKGKSHDEVVKEISIYNAGLIVLAGLSMPGYAPQAYFVVIGFGLSFLLCRKLTEAQQTIITPEGNALSA
jgi:UDP-N-acetylmuramyl pentapeptide phosphotransferase/UDP-N-acetylglucosamine-1-phosphate transferase